LGIRIVDEVTVKPLAGEREDVAGKAEASGESGTVGIIEDTREELWVKVRQGHGGDLG